MASNSVILILVSDRQSRKPTTNDLYLMEQVPTVFFSAAGCSCPRLQTEMPPFLSNNACTVKKIEQAKLDELVGYLYIFCSTTFPVPSLSQSISTTESLSIARDFLGCVDIDDQFGDKEDNICGYLNAKLKDLHRE